MKISTCLVSLLISVSCLADDFVEWVGANSGVNWSAAQIESEGAGVGPANRPKNLAKLLACRAAVVDAQRNLLESIQGVRVQGITLVKNMMLESDVIQSSVEGVLRGAQVIKRDPRDDGSCLVKMIAPLAGRFASDVYGQLFEGQRTSYFGEFRHFVGKFAGAGLELLVTDASAAPQPQPNDWRQAFDLLSGRIDSLEALITTHPGVVERTDTGPSGLVLDARGSNFIPSMSPKIRELRGGIIYPDKEHQHKLRDRGQLVSLFTRDLSTARRHPAVGERPVVLKALRTWGKTRTEIVLGRNSSAKLSDLVSKGFLSDAGVIIVL